MTLINYTSISHLITTNPVNEYSGVEKHEDDAISPQEGVVLEEVVEHAMSPEVSAHIDDRKDTITQSSVLNAMGAVSTGSSSFTSIKPLTLPLTDDMTIKGSKVSIDSSLRWLAETCLFYLKKAHYHLKIIHGRIIRVNSPVHS